jgi:hypothetical protein
MDSLFLTGCDYYKRIIIKDKSRHTWYEKLYILYYENFKTILLVLACIILYKFITISYLPCHYKQYGSGVKSFAKAVKSSVYDGAKGVSGTVTRATLLSKTQKNMERTKSAVSAPFKKESYKKLGSSISSGVKSGYTKSKELGSAGLEYGKAGISYGADQIRENSDFIYKYIAMIFIGIGFSVYIFPVLAMFLIGALTFLIVRKSIAGVITM